MFDRPTIYVDFDDVLCHTAIALTGLLERKTGKRIDANTIASFNLEEAFELSAAELDELMHIAHQDEELAAMRPIARSRENLKQLAEGGYGIHIVTGRPPDSQEASVAWLHANAVPHDALIFVDKYGRADPSTGARRIETLKSSPYVLAVEDSAEMAIYLADECGLCVALLDRPWNRHIAEHVPSRGQITRCRDWDAAVGLLPTA